MTQFEENYTKAAVMFGLKDKWLQEGKLEGKMEAIINTVTLAWKNKYSIEDIMKITNLSKEEVLNIKKLGFKKN